MIKSEEIKVAAAFVVKNEWPLLALSVSHALVHYADKVIIIDTGSQDGTFEGIRVLQSFWNNRVKFIRCNQHVFDQTPLTNLLIQISKDEGNDWTFLLDADEFFVHDDYSQLRKKLGDTDFKWSSYAIRVVNFIVDENHDDFALESFARIDYRVTGVSRLLLSDDEYEKDVISGKIPLQFITTPDKIFLRNSSDIFVSQGSHQVVFGDGEWWVKHDSSVASGDSLGGMICHLPITTEKRLVVRKKRRFFDGAKTHSRLNQGQLSTLSPPTLRSRAVLTPNNQHDWLQTGVIVTNVALSQSLEPVIHRIEKIWGQLSLAKFSSEAENFFPDSFDSKTVSNLIRKYHDRTELLWDGSHREQE